MWALIVVLAHSRHSFVWPTYSQKLEEVIAGLEAVWDFFGGIPKYLVIDNFPAAVAGADSLHPRLTRGFLEYSQHRGFITDPARVRHPRDKPKVERGVQYVRERFFKGGDFKDLTHLRSEAARWCRDVAGLRIHGTTRRQPLQVFLDEERHALIPWDGEPYELAYWRNAKVHQDHHIQCQQALYSVPATLCPPGQNVEVRVDSKLVHIYHRGILLKVHPRQPRGGRATDPADYPAELSAYTTRTPDRIKGKAQELGSGGGRICRTPLRRPTALVQNSPGTQAPAPGGALHLPAPRCRLPQGPHRGPHRCAPRGAHPGAGPGRGGRAPFAKAPAHGPLRPPRQRLLPCYKPLLKAG